MTTPYDLTAQSAMQQLQSALQQPSAAPQTAESASPEQSTTVPAVVPPPLPSSVVPEPLTTILPSNPYPAQVAPPMTAQGLTQQVVAAVSPPTTTINPMSLSQADLLMRIATLEDKVAALEARPKVGGGKTKRARKGHKGPKGRSSRKGRSANRKSK